MANHTQKYSNNQQHLQPKKKTFTFQVHPTRRFADPNTNYSKPVEIGHYSLDGRRGKRSYYKDARHLSYYNNTKGRVRFDLKVGYQEYISKREQEENERQASGEDSRERLDSLLTWLYNNESVCTLKNIKHNITFKPDFVTYRRNYTALLTTPYERRNPWKMALTLFKGTIFFIDVETEKAKEDKLNMTDIQKQMCYWGVKFEDYMTTPSKPCVPGEERKEHSQYRGILHTLLDQHCLLLGAEIDGCDFTRQLKSPDNYVELKTSRFTSSQRQKENFVRFKLLKYWAQSYLGGVPRIVVGLRDDDGIVTSLKEYETLKIPHNAEDDIAVPWDPNICKTFLSRLLAWFKQVVIRDDPHFVYIATFDEPFDFVTIEICTDSSEQFLPKWFVDKYRGN